MSSVPYGILVAIRLIKIEDNITKRIEWSILPCMPNPTILNK
jgi:hypothetical protein